MMKQISPFFIRAFSILLCGFALSLSFMSHAEMITASVSKNKVAKDEVFQLKIVADHKLSSDDIDLSSLSKDFYLGRPSFGSSMNIINGDRSVRSEWTVSLAATQLGQLTIPSFSANGLKTQPIIIQSTMDKSAPNQDDMVEFQTQLEKKQLYPNESTQFHARLIIKADPRRLQNPQIIQPQVEGAHLEAIGDSKQYQSVVDGVEVTIVDQSYRITANNTDNGTTATLLGPKLKGAVVYADNRYGSTRLIQLDTQPDSYNIRILEKPHDFQGFWLPTPSLKLSQTWQDEAGKVVNSEQVFETKVGASLTRTISLVVEGLSETQLPNLILTNPNSFRVYEEKPQFGVTEQGQTVMVLKQVLIPKSTGEMALPPLEMAWWNTQTKQKEIAHIKGLTLRVAPGDDTALTLPDSPSTPMSAPTESIIVKDAGIWPYLTFVFATLWILTLGLVFVLWRRKNHMLSAPVVTAPVEGKNQELLQTIEAGDPIHIQQMVSDWLQRHPSIAEAERHAIESELNIMHMKHFGKSQGTWNHKLLLKLMKKAMKSTAVTKHNTRTQALEKL